MPTLTTGTLTTGGATCEDPTEPQNVWGIFVNASGNLVVYDDIMGSPSLGDSDTPTTIHGGGTIAWVCAAIDASGLIHIVSVVSSNETRDIAYTTYNTTTSTLGTWEEAVSWANIPTLWWAAIGVDDGYAPWIGYIDGLKYHGGTYNHMFHTEKTGASWSTPLQSDDEADNVGIVHPFGWALGNGTDNQNIDVFWPDPSLNLAYRQWTLAGGWGTTALYGTYNVLLTGEVQSWPAITKHSPTGFVWRCYPIDITVDQFKVNQGGSTDNSHPMLPGYMTIAHHNTVHDGYMRSCAYVRDSTNDIKLGKVEFGTWSPQYYDFLPDTIAGTFYRVVGGFSGSAPPWDNNILYSDNTNVYSAKLGIPGQYQTTMGFST